MAIFTVSDSAGLYEALAKAAGGDMIELAAGDYGALNLNHRTNFDFTYDSPITIVSANSTNPAVFSSMNMVGASNITFDNIEFDYTFEADDALWNKPFSISDSTNITIKNSVFDGDMASGTGTTSDGYGTGFGLSVWSSSGVTVDNTEFKSWWKAATFNRVSELTITNNNIHDIRSDGINLSEVQSVLIEGNYIHDFRVSLESGDHADMIQVIATTHSETVTENLTIRGNTLDIGEGNITQMIYMANGKYDETQDDAWLYQNITVEDNLIRGSHVHGISVGATNGVIIRNNTMLNAEHPDGVAAPVIRTNMSTNVLIEGNAVPGIVSADNPEPTWTIQNNVILQNDSPELAGYYENQFITSSMGGSVGDFVLDPGGVLATSGVGATWMELDTSPGTPTPLFDVQSTGTDSQTLVFDASHTYGSTGVMTADDAEFRWVFGDGTTATGQIVEHRFAAAGIYDVILEVVLPDGATVTAKSDAYVVGSDALAFNASDGAFYLQSYGTETVLAGTDVASVADGSGGMTVDLSASENLAAIPQQHFNNLLGSKSFDISMSFQADQPGVSQGWLLHLHSALTVMTYESGDIQVNVWDDAGSRFILTSANQTLNDGDVHSFEIQLDDQSDTLQLLVDGAVSDSTTFSGALSQGINHSLKFGSPWGNSFDGQMHSFDLNITASDYSVFEGALEGPTTDPVSDPIDETSLPTLDDFVSDFAQLTTKQLYDDAHIVTTESGSAIHLDGDDDYVNLGRLTEFETSQQLSFSVDFQRGTVDGGRQRLVMNQKKIALDVAGDGLEIRVKQVDTGFKEAISIDNLGLDDTDLHQVIVMVDAVTDRLQVVLDGALVLDKQDSDIELVGIGPERGWKIGTQWRADFDGEVHDFRMDSSADFLPEDLLVLDDASLLG